MVFPKRGIHRHVFPQNSLFLKQQFKKQHYFTVSPLSNYYADGNLTDIDVNQFPTNMLAGSSFANMSSQNFRQICKIEITTGLDNVAKLASSMIYAIFGILSVILIRIILRGNPFKATESINIFASILVFLPILLFTFRTFLAPNYITLIDLIGFILILIYGVLLCFEFYKKTRKRNMNDYIDY